MNLGPGPQPSLVRAGDLDVAYLDFGDGPPIVLLHGFPDIATTFLPMAERLTAAGYRCIAPWSRGYPPTGDGPYHDTGTRVADLVALVEALDVAPARIVGHDWGADTAYGLAAARPELVRALVALALPPVQGVSLPRFADYEQLRRSFYIWFFQLPNLPEAVVPLDDFAFVRRLWRDWSPGWDPPAEHVDRVVETLSRPGVTEAAIDYYRAMFRPTRHDRAHSELRAAAAGTIEPPTLLLMGADDGALDPATAVEAGGVFRGPFAFEVLPGCGHWLHLERPDEVAERVLAWFAEH